MFVGCCLTACSNVLDSLLKVGEVGEADACIEMNVIKDSGVLRLVCLSAACYSLVSMLFAVLVLFLPPPHTP